jgi:hypothetical protein
MKFEIFISRLQFKGDSMKKALVLERGDFIDNHLIKEIKERRTLSKRS